MVQSREKKILRYRYSPLGLKVATQEHKNGSTGSGVKNRIIDIRVMKICITNTGVEVDPSAKKFKENLYKGGGVLTLGAPFFNMPSGCLIPYLSTSMQ